MADPASELSAARRQAEALLRAGIPINPTAQAGEDYLSQCQSVSSTLRNSDPLTFIKIKAAQIVVATHVTPMHNGIDLGSHASDELTALADRLDDEVARAYAKLAWWYTHQTPEHSAERVRIAYEILDTAKQHQETPLIPVTYVLLLVGLLECGEIRSLDIELLEQRLATWKSQNPHLSTVAAWFKCLRFILDGDTVNAEQQAESILHEAKQHGFDSLALYTAQMGMIRWMQGRIDGAEEGFLAARREYPEQLLWAASLAWLWLLQGRRESGLSLLASLPDLAELPRDRYWLSTMTVLAEISIVTGSRARREQIRDLLLPFADHLVPVGVGVAFWGTCARTLGLLEERLGLLDDAREHLELAITLSSRIGALAWHAEAQIELAEFAIRHELTDISAYELLAEARATSEARGFAALAWRAMHRPRIQVLGTFEVVSLCGVRASWTSNKARELLKMLVAARGVTMSKEVFMDVLWPGEAPESLSNRFSVALNVIRRALDPQRLQPTQHYVVTQGDSVRLEVDHLDIDLERFLTLATRSDDESRAAARRLYRGDAFSADVYSDWAVSVRDHAKHVWQTLMKEEHDRSKSGS